MATAKKVGLPKELVGKTLAYYIKSPRHGAHLGIYTDNRAIILFDEALSQEEESPDEAFTMSAGGKGVAADLSLFEETMDLAMSLYKTSAEKLPKEEATLVAEKLGIPKKIRWKREAFLSSTDDDNVLCFTWSAKHKKSEPVVKGHIAIIVVSQYANILRILTKQPPLPDWIKIAGVSDIEKSCQLLEMIFADETLFTLDVETYDPRGNAADLKDGLNPWDGRIRLLQIYAPEKGMCAILDFGPRHMLLPYPQEVIDKLQECLIGTTCIFHNALFDLGFMTLQWGIDWYKTSLKDTMLLSQNYWAGVKFLGHGLGDCSIRWGFGPMDKGLQKSDFGLPLCMQQYIYGAEDTRVTHRGYEHMTMLMDEPGKYTNKRAAQIDQDYLHVAHMIRTRGVPINIETTQQVYDETKAYMEPKALAWEEGSGLPRNAHWTKLIPWLEDRGHNVMVYDRATKKEKKSSNKSVLKEAAKTDPVIQSLLDYRVAHTRLQYIEGMLNCNRDGKVFCGIRVLASQGMGRTSSGQIIKGQYQTLNIQNCLVKGHLVPVVGRGVVPIEDVQKGDIVWGYKQGRIVKTQVTGTVAQQYSGNIHKFNMRYLSQEMTANHHLYFKDDYYLPLQKGLYTKNYSDLVQVAEFEDSISYGVSLSWLRFIVATFADGSFTDYQIIFGFRKRRKIERLEHILNRLNLEYRKVEGKTTYFYIHRTQIPEEISTIPGFWAKQYSYAFVELLSGEQCRSIAREWQYWDGCLLSKNASNTESIQFCSKAGDLEVCKELALKAGYFPKQKGKQQWTFSFTLGETLVGKTKLGYMARKTAAGRNVPHSIRHVNNLEVYCLTTETSNFVVETPVGAWELTGNCANENREYPELPDIRKCFEAEEGYSFIVIDLSSSHIRLAAWFCQALGYMDKFQPGECVHCFNASIIIAACVPGTPLGEYKALLAARNHDREAFLATGHALNDKLWEEYQSDAEFYRKVSKVAIYTKINKGSAGVFRTQLKAMAGIELSLEECQVIMEALGKGFPELDAWLGQQLRDCNNNSGYTNFNYGKANYATPDDDEEEDDEDTDKKALVDYGLLVAPTGRMRYVPRYKYTSKRGNTWTSAKINDVSAHDWQSPEADIEKITQIRFLREYILKNNLLDKVWIPNFVHDEVQSIAANTVVLEAATIFGKINEEEWLKVCPVVTCLEGTPEDWIGKNWAEVH